MPLTVRFAQRGTAAASASAAGNQAVGQRAALHGRTRRWRCILATLKHRDDSVRPPQPLQEHRQQAQALRSTEPGETSRAKMCWLRETL